MGRWRFGEGQTWQEEHREIREAQAAGREREYLDGQQVARMREREAARGSARRAAQLLPPKSSEPLRLTRAEIAAGQTRRGGFSRSTLAKWGVPWPPPKGWRKALERGERVPGGSSPVVVRQGTYWPARAHTRAWTTDREFRMVEEAMAKRA